MPTDLFTNRPPSRAQGDLLDAITAAMLATAEVIESLPTSRERSLAMTKLEECSMWAKKAVVFTVDPEGLAATTAQSVAAASVSTGSDTPGPDQTSGSSTPASSSEPQPVDEKGGLIPTPDDAPLDPDKGESDDRRGRTGSEDRGCTVKRLDSAARERGRMERHHRRAHQGGRRACIDRVNDERSTGLHPGGPFLKPAARHESGRRKCGMTTTHQHYDSEDREAMADVVDADRRGDAGQYDDGEHAPAAYRQMLTATVDWFTYWDMEPDEWVIARASDGLIVDRHRQLDDHEAAKRRLGGSRQTLFVNRSTGGNR